MVIGLHVKILNGCNGPLARYVKLRVAHATGMPGTFSPRPRVSGPDMHHGACVTHVPWCIPGSQTSGFLWNRWRGKRSRHSRCMRNQQFYVSGKRPMWQNHALETLSALLALCEGNSTVTSGRPHKRGVMLIFFLCKMKRIVDQVVESISNVMELMCVEQSTIVFSQFHTKILKLEVIITVWKNDSIV